LTRGHREIKKAMVFGPIYIIKILAFWRSGVHFLLILACGVI